MSRRYYTLRTPRKPGRVVLGLRRRRSGIRRRRLRGRLVSRLPKRYRDDGTRSQEMMTMPDEQTNILLVGTDRRGRTWRVLDRADGSFAFYYTQGRDERRFVLYDSADIWSDPPRVLLARAERAEQEARRLKSELEEARATGC